MSNNTPKRPSVTQELVLKAIEGKCIGMPFSAEQFAEQFDVYKDSYEIARDLDRRHYLDLTCDHLDLIDDLIGFVSEYHRAAVKQWFEDNNIQPPYPIGTVLNKGIITGIDTYTPAQYLVKENGCNNPNRWLIIKFEDAVLAGEVAA